MSREIAERFDNLAAWRRDRAFSSRYGPDSRARKATRALPWTGGVSGRRSAGSGIRERELFQGLHQESLVLTFDVFRGNDLIVNYVVSNWLMGQGRPLSISWPGTPTAPGCRPRCCLSVVLMTSDRVYGNLVSGRFTSTASGATLRGTKGS